jgi:formate dehydrogenase subunit gamma
MLATGILLYLPTTAGVLGSRESVKATHLYLASAWVVALLVIAALGDRRALRETAREVDLFDADDSRWLRGRSAPQGRFNAGQKVHAVVQAAFAALFLVSGALLYYGERDTRFRLDGTILLHDGVTVLASLLVVGHLYLAVVHRPTRPALRGIVVGTVREDWSQAHHAKWAPAHPGARPRAALRRPLTWALLAAAIALAVATVAVVPSSSSSTGPGTAAGPGR